MKSKFVLLASLAIALGVSGQASAQDLAAGERSYLKCKPCHQVGETAKNTVGPVLNGIIGRKAGTYENYNYSDANKNSGLTWDEETLRAYLTDPKAKVPGTKMIFPGIKREKQLDDLMAYLKGIKADGSGI